MSRANLKLLPHVSNKTQDCGSCPLDFPFFYAPYFPVLLSQTSCPPALSFQLSPVRWVAHASHGSSLEKMPIFLIDVLDMRGHFGALWKVRLFCFQQTWWKRSEKAWFIAPTDVKMARLRNKAASGNDQNTGSSSQIRSCGWPQMAWPLNH